MPRFVVHEHFSSHHHWDMRLELDGVLMSWAVPKEPPIKSGIRRLCILVEPHDLSYINFEGTIEEGHYGAGKIELWDHGTYEMETRRDNKMVFFLHGKKLKGRYTILKFGKAGPDNWLFFKTKAEKKL